MQNVSLKLVTIICEPILSAELTALAKSIGATGFTVTEVQGEGSSHRQSGEIPDAKIKIELISDSALATKFLEEVASTYFENYSVIAYVTDVSVIRAKKF